MRSAITRGDAAGLKEEDIFDLDEAYEAWVLSEARDKRGGVFHPSAADMCARRNVYEYTNTQPRGGHGPEDKEVFRLGHAVHGVVQAILGDLSRVLAPRGITCHFQPEVPFDPQTDSLYHDFGIGGTTDGLLTLTGDGWQQRGVVEIKSISDDGFGKLSGPKKGHLMQANLYAFRYDTPVLWFWYYNKNNSKRKVYRRTFDDAIFDEVVARFASQRAYADSGTLPEREESYYMCPRCEYAWTCEPSSMEHIRRQQKLVQIQNRGGFGRK